MIIKVTLRYRGRTSVRNTIEKEVPEGTTAGDITQDVIREHEVQEGIRFSGANVAILQNGRIIPGTHQLHDGDELEIIPVAAGG